MMSATTDFGGWLDDAGPQGYEEVWEIAQAVESGGEYGRFKGKKSGDQTVLTAGSGYEALILASSAAEDKFLNMIRGRYCDGMTIEGYYEFNRQLDREEN